MPGPAPFGPPALETARLRLRPLVAADAEALRTVTDDVAITANISFLTAPFTLDQSLALIARNRGAQDLFRGAFRREDGVLAGLVGVHADGTGAIEIGYWIGSLFQGRGYATEAAHAVLAALDGDRASAVFAECRSDNRASWRVLQKLGFRPTGEPGKRAGRVKLIRSARGESK